MLTSQKAFVVLDIPSPWKEAIQAIRDELNTVTAKLPVEITVAGSAGVGPIPEGTAFELIRSEVDRIARVTAPVVMEFGAIGHFPGTGVFFLSPRDRQPFDQLHASFAASRIPFIRSPFAYNPHCTLRVGPVVEQSVLERIYGVPIPRGEMRLDSLLVYTARDPHGDVHLLHRRQLTG